MCRPRLCINSRSDRCPTDVPSLGKTDYNMILKYSSKYKKKCMKSPKRTAHIRSCVCAVISLRLITIQSSKAAPYRALPDCRLSELLRDCKVGQGMGRDAELVALNEGPVTVKGLHSPPLPKKKTSCDTFINSAHVPHF